MLRRLVHTAAVCAHRTRSTSPPWPVPITTVTKHTAHRRIVSPAFAPQVLTKIANTTMREHAMALHGQLVDECMKSGGSRTECTVTVKGLIHRTALNIIAESAFHLDKPEVDAFAASLPDMFLLRFNLLRLFRITPILRHFPFHLLDRQYYRRRQITKTVAQIAQKLKQEGALSSGGRAIVDYLIASNQLTDEQIRDHSLTFMFAGFDTSSNTIQWTLALLAKHQGVQDKLFEELQDAMGPNTCPDIDDIKQIRYLQHVVKESMRYRPVISTRDRVMQRKTMSCRTAVKRFRRGQRSWFRSTLHTVAPTSTAPAQRSSSPSDGKTRALSIGANASLGLLRSASGRGIASAGTLHGMRSLSFFR